MAQSLKAALTELIGISANIVLDDWTWRVFGYRKRPKRGAFFTKFIKKSKIIRETFLVREIFIMCSSSGIIEISKKVDDEILSKVIRSMVDDLLDYDGITVAFRFNSKREAENYIIDGIYDYVNAEFEEFNSVLFKRAQVYTEKYINNGWFISASRLIVEDNSPLVVINKTTEELLKNELIYDI
ncbi:hypothetical protein NSQ20_25545 [Paenibacillus sp. FSL K6-1122]|uniref:hypothetical protein n=1 Tax=Paenibacillus sp. FSL K6-1122 TaxID=2954512 RepID=UPI0030EDB7DA